MTRLCCLSLAGLIWCGRWSPLPCHCRVVAAGLSQTREEGVGTLVGTITVGDIWIDKGLLLNKQVEEQQLKSLPNLPYAKLLILHTVQCSTQLMQMMHRSSHLMCYQQVQGRDVPHQIHHPWTSDPPSALLSFSVCC